MQVATLATVVQVSGPAAAFGTANETAAATTATARHLTRHPFGHALLTADLDTPAPHVRQLTSYLGRATVIPNKHPDTKPFLKQMSIVFAYCAGRLTILQAWIEHPLRVKIDVPHLADIGACGMSLDFFMF